MFNIKALLNNIRNRYWIALSIIAITISFAFFILTQQHSMQEGLANNVNVAGQQRMLSQKVALLVSRHIEQLRRDNKTLVDASPLQKAAMKMQENQQHLNAIFKEKMPENLAALYGAQGRLNQRITEYTNIAISLSQIKEAQQLSRLELSVFNVQPVEALLQDLEQAVQYIEQDIVFAEQQTGQLEIVLWCIILATILLVAYYTLKPIQLAIRKTYERLEEEQYKVSDYRVALNKHSLSIKFSLSKTILTVNKKFTNLYGYEEQELIGKNVSLMFSNAHKVGFWQEIFDTIQQGQVWRGDVCAKSKSGRLFWFDTTIVPLKNRKKVIESFMVLQNDITEQVSTQTSLRQLHEVTANSSMSLADKINAILEQGKALYHLPLAIVSQISGEEYKVRYASTPNGEVKPGDVFDLGNTYCYHTLMANKPKAFHHAGQSEIKGHPCYQAFGLESYIGAPIFVGRKRYGTLNFSGSEPYPYPFKHSDLELIQLMAHWIGYELERHDQQAYLVDQQQLMEQMSQLARIGAWEVDLISQTINWSNMTKNIHEVDQGYKPDLATAMNFYKEGESRERIKVLVEKSISDGLPYNEELQLVTAKGNEIWVAAKGESIFKDGKCVRLFGSFQDITEKKKTEQALQAQNRRMSLAADSAGIGVWEYDIENDTLKWDDWMFKLYGVDKERFSGAYEAWENGVHPDDIELASEALQVAIDTGEKLELQYRILWPDGSLHYLIANALVIKNERQKVVSMIGVNYDVTERVENEIALTQAKLEAEAGARAKNEFLASMSHEIRTPMNGVIGMLDLLKDSSLTAEQEHRVDIAQSSATSLLHLINDILDFSKIDADKLDLEEISFDLASMMGELVKSFTTQIEAKNIDLILDTLAMPASYIVGDSSRIRQILTNLISNSIKFTHQGEVVVSANLQATNQNNSQLQLQVTDTGIGIAEDKRDSLFDSFSQVDASTTREYGGTGLGLSIVKKLCVLMGGDVTVESELGKGSSFTVEFPVGVSTIHDEKVMRDISELHFLLVEPNKTSAQNIAKQYQKWGAKVSVAHSAEQAMQLCNDRLGNGPVGNDQLDYDPLDNDNRLFDLMIICASANLGNNVNLAKDLFKDNRLAGIPVFFMTSIQVNSSLSLSKDMNCIGQFSKPVTTKDLRSVIDILFESRRSSLESAQQTNDVDNKPVDSIEGAPTSPQSLGQLTALTNKKILLVEDNRVNQMVAKGVLGKVGIECDIAGNGKEAVEQLLKHPDHFALILMDIQMPEMDGYQATQAIRRGDAGDSLKEITIIAMTANAMRGDREKCLEAGMNDYLAKPINKNAVVEKLTFWLDRD